MQADDTLAAVHGRPLRAAGTGTVVAMARAAVAQLEPRGPNPASKHRASLPGVLRHEPCCRARMTFRRAALALAFTSLNSCGGSVDPSGPMKPPPSFGSKFVSVDPGELATSMGQTPPTISIGTGGKYLSDEQKAYFRASVRIVAWPERTPIPADIYIADGPTNTPYATLRLVPKSTLPARWLALDVAGVPPGLHWAPGLKFPLNSNGSADIRFRPDAYTTFRYLSVCAKSDGGVTGDIAFTEPLTATSWTSIRLASAGTPITMQQRPETYDAGNGKTLPAVYAGDGWLGASFDAGGSLHLSIGAGVQGADGTNVAPMDLTVGFATMIPEGDGCSYYWPTSP
jgi:hypothetical protein